MSDSAAAARFGLRARLRPVTVNRRERLCGVTVTFPKDSAAFLVCAGVPGKWSACWSGVMTCGHIWTCPVCSAKLRAERVDRIDRALRVAGGRWQMVTFTVSHREGMPLAPLLHGLAGAFRRVKQGGKLQHVWKGRVSASVRAFEVTYGANGWHPHVHVLLRTSEWTENEREQLARRWKAAVSEHIGPDCLPSDVRGVVWSPAFDAKHADERKRARYLGKLGAEIAGVAKDARAGSWSSWDIAEEAARKSPLAISLWREFSEATRGRRMLEMDDRCARFADAFVPSEGEGEAPNLDDSMREVAPRESAAVKVVRVQLWRTELASLRRYERFSPAVMGLLVAAVRVCVDPVECVREWLAIAHASGAA